MKQIATIALTTLLSLGTQALHAQLDCLGVFGGTAIPGSACNDGNPITINDTWNLACQCVGTCPVWSLPLCDDGNPNTINDAPNNLCWCIGWGVNGCADGAYPPGTPCDDMDPLTSNDAWTVDCNCFGGSNTISGQLFLDVDQDSLFGGPDLPIQNRVVSVSPGGYGVVTGPSGTFTITVPTGTFSLWAQSGYYDAQAEAYPPIPLIGSGLSSTGHLVAMIAPVPQTDLSVAFGSSWVRPGFENTVTVLSKNEGTVPALGTLSFTFDTTQTIVSVVPPATVVGNLITWPQDNYDLGEITTAEVVFLSDTDLVLGSQVHYTADLQTAPPDDALWNNTQTTDITVFGSYDPNDKLVSPALLTVQDVADGVPVTYTIRFQNTGTALAENVRITDPLPFGVDHGSFQFLGASHACEVVYLNGLLEFRFDGIMLPDSGSDAVGSHGLVMFRVTPDDTLLPGDSVANTAYIYFDFNVAVVTPPAVFAVETSTGVAAASGSGTELWPNPAGDELYVAMPDAGSVAMTIIDLNGRVVRAISGNGGGAIAIPLSGLAHGVYALRLEQGGAMRTLRFVKR